MLPLLLSVEMVPPVTSTPVPKLPLDTIVPPAALFKVPTDPPDTTLTPEPDAPPAKMLALFSNAVSPPATLIPMPLTPFVWMRPVPLLVIVPSEVRVAMLIAMPPGSCFDWIVPLFKMNAAPFAPVATAGCVPAPVIVRLPAAVFVSESPALSVKKLVVLVCTVVLVKAVCARASQDTPAIAKPATEASSAARCDEKYI